MEIQLEVSTIIHIDTAKIAEFQLDSWKNNLEFVLKAEADTFSCYHLLSLTTSIW